MRRCAGSSPLHSAERFAPRNPWWAAADWERRGIGNGPGWGYERTGCGSSGVFISYRRTDSDYPAGWLFERLAERFGRDRVFKDVDSLQPGDDFAEVITAAASSCSALVAVIGERWLTITDEYGRRRLDDPDDFVRLEIEAALNRGVRVSPVLVDRASMPAPLIFLPACSRWHGVRLSSSARIALTPARSSASWISQSVALLIPGRSSLGLPHPGCAKTGPGSSDPGARHDGPRMR
jgi:TIR domain